MTISNSTSRRSKPSFHAYAFPITFAAPNKSKSDCATPHALASADRTCRICHGPINSNDSTSDQRGISPCKCRGTSKYVHWRCHHRWRVSNRGKFAFTHCTVCLYKFAFERLSSRDTYTDDRLQRDVPPLKTILGAALSVSAITSFLGERLYADFLCLRDLISSHIVDFIASVSKPRNGQFQESDALSSQHSITAAIVPPSCGPLCLCIVIMLLDLACFVPFAYQIALGKAQPPSSRSLSRIIWTVGYIIAYVGVSVISGRYPIKICWYHTIFKWSVYYLLRAPQRNRGPLVIIDYEELESEENCAQFWSR